MSDERDPTGETEARAPEQSQPEPASHPSVPGEHEPSSGQPEPAPAWDPWTPVGATPAGAPSEPAPGPPAGPSPESTQPVDLSHTQDLGGGSAASPQWAHEPTGWPAAAPLPPGATDPGATDTRATAPGAAAPGAAAPGAAAPGAAAPGAGYPQGGDRAAYPPPPPGPWGAQPGTAGSPRRSAPSWGALIAVAAIAALVAGVLGGLFGGWLGATGRNDLAGRTGSSIPTAGSGATARPAGSIAAIAARALPSVVTIKVKGADGTGTGSGFVLDREGRIITNNHVVAGAASGGAITVELSNGTEVPATIVGRDGSYDLAVLKISRTDLRPLVMGSSKDVVVGDQVIAVGAPLGLESTVTAGIVSAVNRPVSPGGDGDQQSFINAIQTDAAINPGNSGGPLLDMQGHVIGINSAIARVPGSTDTQSGNIGVGFSIPSDQVVKTARQLITSGKAQHPIIGVVLDRQYTGDGVRVLQRATSTSGLPVSPGGPAAKAGIKPGDVIVEFDGKRVSNPDDLVVAIRAKSVGDKVSIKILRGGRTLTVTLTLAGTSGS